MPESGGRGRPLTSSASDWGFGRAGVTGVELEYITPQIAYRVTAYRVDFAYRVGFTQNQIILGIYVVRTDLIVGRYSVAYRVD